ncbi:efflux RND transporter periplasmic adaptor subunit [Pantoea sp. FN0307]|uniref:efflux RND transporter periplasmic adaptor subunit n=1 Tax=Pantoea sp. FN0307 TaxID=3418560 RepID=UPI003CED9A3D
MFTRSVTKLLLLFMLVSLSGCDADSESQVETEVAPAVVAVKVLTEQPVVLEKLYPGRVAALRTAQIRPQVSGIITSMLFNQGSEIKAGQPLFQIDPAPFQAEVNSAAAALEKAQASHQQLKSRSTRLAKLRGTGAISQQDYEDAASVTAQASAAVSEARAVLERKKLDLSYATVRAPIDGRVDQNFVTEGALVSASDSQAMATLQQIDSVYVDVRQPAAELSQLPVKHNQLTTEGLPIQAEVISATGDVLTNSASLLFTGVSVDPGTGDVVMRLRVNNSDKTLLPGMYVQAKLSRQLSPGGLLIPQEAVLRINGKTRVWIDDAGKARSTEVELGEVLKGNYFVRKGLQAGDRLVVQGAERLQEGIPIQADTKTTHI